MIIHEFSGNGTLVLFDQNDAADGVAKMTKRMEITADGNHVIMVLTTLSGDSPQNAPDAAKKEVKMRIEDLMSLINAYVEIAY